MGKPEKIVDLAKRMISLSGRTDVKIEFTGLLSLIHIFFRDKDGFHFRLFGGKPVHYRQNLMVGDAFGKGITLSLIHI